MEDVSALSKTGNELGKFDSDCEYLSIHEHISIQTFDPFLHHMEHNIPCFLLWSRSSEVNYNL